MAKEVVVRILSGGEDRSPNPTAATEAKKPNSNAKNSRSTTQIVGMYVANKVWSTLKAEAQYHAGKYLNMTENYKAEVTVQNAVSTIDDIMGIATASMAGFQMGGVAGMAVSATAAVLSKTTSKLHRYEDAAKSIIENAYSNYFYGERAGFVVGKNGTEN